MSRTRGYTKWRKILSYAMNASIAFYGLVFLGEVDSLIGTGLGAELATHTIGVVKYHDLRLPIHKVAGHRASFYARSVAAMHTGRGIVSDLNLVFGYSFRFTQVAVAHHLLHINVVFVDTGDDTASAAYTSFGMKFKIYLHNLITPF